MYPTKGIFFVSKKAVRSEKFSISFSSGFPFYGPLLEALSCLRTIMSGYRILFHNKFAATATTLTVDGTTTTWTATADSTSLEVIVSGTTTTLSIDGTTTDLVLTKNTTVELRLAGLTTQWVVGDASTDVSLDGTATTITVTGSTSVQ